ncbi:MAG: glycosyltransferase family 39 protein [Thaumarchaeota archaeon]|nr:glycosyltransferase family 39 protein [Nitrososphaerota archaeon]
MKRSALLSAIALLAMLVILIANARTQSEWALAASQVASVVSLAGGIVAGVAGARHAYAMRPELRRSFLLVGTVTLAVFLAHLYVVNSPSTFVSSSLSGNAEHVFSDSNVQVVSSFVGPNLTLHIADVGESAISGMTVSLDGRELPPSGLAPLPTPSRPIQPSQSASLGYVTQTVGSWNAAENASSTVTVNYQLLNCYHVPKVGDDKAVYGCVMDEVFYVPSAQGILTGQQCAQYADSCNLEHPPLAKALIAGGMAVFGVNDLGWRIGNVVLGTLSIPLLFVLVLVLGGGKKLACYSSVLFSLDIMFFVHSSIAVIDVPAVFFSLLGATFYFRKTSLWRVDNYVASGVFFALAALSKETALFSVAAVVGYDLIFGQGPVRSLLTRMTKMLIPTVLLFIAVIQLFDTIYTSSAQPWFYQQVNFMFSYGASLTANVLKCQPTTGYWCKFPGAPGGPPILPIDWLLFYTPVGYLITNVTVSVAGGTPFTYVGVGYYGTTNAVVVWLVFAWLPLVIYQLVKWRRTRAPLEGELRPAAFMMVWFLLAYIPYLLLFAYGRVTYPFYIIPAIPAIASGAAYFVTRDWFPSKMALIYVASAFAIFFLYFPVKDFLPSAVRVLLGR